MKKLCPRHPSIISVIGPKAQDVACVIRVSDNIDQITISHLMVIDNKAFLYVISKYNNNKIP